MIRTNHIQSLISEGLALAELVDGNEYPNRPVVDMADGRREVPPDHVLSRAANLLRHAAEELEDERMRVLGWPQI